MRIDAAFLQRMAARCRELANRTQDETAKEQLGFWAAEFEEEAAWADLAEHAQ